MPNKQSRLLNKCFRLKLCTDHLLEDVVYSETGRQQRLCRKCHRLEDVTLFEVRAPLACHRTRAWLFAAQMCACAAWWGDSAQALR